MSNNCTLGPRCLENMPTYCYKMSMYGKHQKAGQNTQLFNEINKVMCNM